MQEAQAPRPWQRNREVRHDETSISRFVRVFQPIEREPFAPLLDSLFKPACRDLDYSSKVVRGRIPLPLLRDPAFCAIELAEHDVRGGQGAEIILVAPELPVVLHGLEKRRV